MNHSLRCQHAATDPVAQPLIFTSWSPDPAGQILGTGYDRFTTNLGIDGLGKYEGDRLDVLAVAATAEGTGQFRAFIRAAQAQFRVVAVWEVWNPIVADALKRYGFSRAFQFTAPRESLRGWMWTAGCNL